MDSIPAADKEKFQVRFFCPSFFLSILPRPWSALEKWSGHGKLKILPKCRRHKMGQRGFPPHSKGVQRQLKIYGFRTSVDAFLLHLECVLLQYFSQCLTYSSRIIRLLFFTLSYREVRLRTVYKVAGATWATHHHFACFDFKTRLLGVRMFTYQ